MRKLPIAAFAGIAAAVLAGTAIAAASQKSHQMDVPLPDGAVAHITYYGDVAPKVTVAPPSLAGLDRRWVPLGLPSFAGFDRMIEQMNRQMQQIARQPVGGPGMNVASYGSLPAGSNTVSVVSYSNGGDSCTRTTEVVSQGDGKPPRVTTNVSGDCSAQAPAAPMTPVPPPRSSAPIDHT